MDHQRLAQLLFPDITTTPEDIEKMYPPRNLPEGAKVTRMAPSPTGFMHLGNLFSAIVGERLAHQSNGVFFLRIEDTDLKRAVEGGVEKIINVFNHYGLNFDEGATIDGDNGAYGPYRQRQRAKIYQTFAKQLVERGLAYPCFCTEEELTEMREKQQEMKINFGYYGEWAKCRNLSFEEIEANIKAGKPYVLRFRSEGDPNKRFTHHDLVKGDIELPENDQDIVLLKSDGIPTYHFAHVVDDHLMQTTHVVRGEEWLATLNIHLQLFRTMGWKAPKYVHTAQLMKMDGGSKRKLSKRKDPELALDYLVAPPRMKLYMDYSARVFEVYLKYIAPEDIHPYSIDEVFMDVTNYLSTYGLSPRGIAERMIQDVLKTTGITATAGIGPNLYLCKVAMDIVAKRIKPDQNGVRIASLNERSYRRLLWDHRPFTDFWRVGHGYAKKLEAHGLHTMGDIARCSVGKPTDYYNEKMLYQLFGVNAELLIDHAWGWEPCTIADIKAYKPEFNSIGSGQVLQEPYSFAKVRLVVCEMADQLALDLVDKGLVTKQLTLTVGYDRENLQDPHDGEEKA